MLTLPKVPSILKPLVQPFRRYYLPLYREKADREVGTFASFLSKDDILGEIGTHIGASTKFYSRHCKFVYTFEANKDIFDLTRRYLANCPNVSPFNIAISDHNGQSMFYAKSLSRENSVSGLLGRKYEKRVRVPCRRIDDLSCSARMTALVIDAEGSEVAVLEGAKRTLSHIERVAVETHLTNEMPEGTSAAVKERLKDFVNSFAVKSCDAAQELLVFQRSPS